MLVISQLKKLTDIPGNGTKFIQTKRKADKETQGNTNIGIIKDIKIIMINVIRKVNE